MAVQHPVIDQRLTGCGWDRLRKPTLQSIRPTPCKLAENTASRSPDGPIQPLDQPKYLWLGGTTRYRSAAGLKSRHVRCHADRIQG
jgi:hypothetical protein